MGVGAPGIAHRGMLFGCFGISIGLGRARHGDQIEARGWSGAIASMTRAVDIWSVGAPGILGWKVVSGAEGWVAERIWTAW